VSPLRVGLNLLYLAPGETGGMEVYARALVPELLAAAPDAEFVAFCGSELYAEMRERPWAEGLRVVGLPGVSSRTRLARSAAEQSVLPAAAVRARLDVLHSLANTMPGAYPGRTVTTVHDLIHLRFPETHAGLLGHGMAALARLSVLRSDRLVADSQATATDLVELLGADRRRVDVVPLGPGFDEAADPTPEADLRARLELGDRPIVLSVSAKRPHKNLMRLVETMAGLPPDRDAVLVIPGYANPHEDELRARAAELGAADRVRFTGWTSEADLEGLYGAATLVAFPSLAEGFGLPVLEAMRRGVPVACSDASSLPEVAGDAALLFDPGSLDAMRTAVDRLLTDPELRADLATRGRAQAARFSWRRAAQETVASYRRALGAAETRLASP
jgi:glycosyltransferase involved in cell wall biosynthesis